MGFIDFQVGKKIGFPVCKEHIGEVFYRFAFEHNGIVFPMAEAIDAIDVFISEVEAPTKGGMAVDHNHFAVVAVI